MTHLDVYTEGGVPSNMQVLGVKSGTIDIAKLAAGPAAINDIINLFDLDASEQVVAGGFQIIEATDDVVTLDLGLGGGDTFGDGEIGDTPAISLIDALPAPFTAGTVTIKVLSAIATKGKIRIWLVVAEIADNATYTALDTPAP